MCMIIIKNAYQQHHAMYAHF